MMQRIIGSLALLLALTSGLAASIPQPTPQLVVSTDWLATHLHDKNLVVLHVGGDQTSYVRGHIPGARLLSIADVVTTRNGVPNQLPAVADLKAVFERVGVGDTSQVVLYSDAIGLLAARVYFTLDYLGHGNRAALLDGGLEKWKAERRDLSTTPATQDAAGKVTFTPKPRSELIVDLAAVQQIVAAHSATLIDARPPDEYAGRKPGEGIRQAGHIPGATNVFWVNNLVSPSNFVLKPTAEIRATYQSAGVRPGRKVIVYCRTGVQAAHDYFTLKLIGVSPVLYNGSFLEWSNSFAAPVETGAQAVR
jgi:thiosulfate/3-mercaptopyruvate sulfurtransferase